MKSAPAWTPALVRRHPALLVEWLRLANSLSRWRARRRHAALLVLTTLAAVLALLVAASGHIVSAIQTLAEYWLLLAAVTAIYAATSVSGRRRRLEESESQSWLVATPIPPRSLLISQAIRVLLPLVALLMVAGIFLLLLAATNEEVAAATGTVAVAAAGGLLSGVVVGWWSGGRVQSSGVVPSRYVPRSKVPPIEQLSAVSSRHEQQARPSSDLTGVSTSLDANVTSRLEILASFRPDSSALAGWPIAQVFSWSRPENSRYVLIAALLAVQGGSSAIAGLSVVAMYVLASYLAALLSAMTTVGRSAAIWLRATPMTLMGFVWSLSRRALAHQLIGTTLAIVCMLLLGAPISVALELASMWLGLFISISGFALVDNYRGRSPLVKIALSVAIVAALATVLQLRAGAKT